MSVCSYLSQNSESLSSIHHILKPSRYLNAETTSSTAAPKIA